ncbi:unnamed protein product, partial [Laminaria digitata]
FSRRGRQHPRLQGCGGEAKPSKKRQAPLFALPRPALHRHALPADTLVCALRRPADNLTCRSGERMQAADTPRLAQHHKNTPPLPPPPPSPTSRQQRSTGNPGNTKRLSTHS